MTIKIKKSEVVALIATCASRLIHVEIYPEGNTGCAYAEVDCDNSQGLYLMKEFGERIEQDRQFNESCDRVSGQMDSTFDLLKAITRPSVNG
jgi:hypothetical protein